MAKTLDQLPTLPQPLQGTDIILLKTVIDSVPLDFKIDVNTFLQNYVELSEIGTDVGNIIRLVDDGGGNAGLPPVSGALLTNIIFQEATGLEKGIVFLSDATNSGNDVTTGFAATSKAVRDVSVASVQKAGDTMSGTLEFVNNIGIDFNTFGGTPFNGIKMTAADDLEVGQTVTTFDNIKLLANTSVKVCDNTGAEVFSFNTDGTIAGINADDIVFTPYSFVTATEVQSAIQQVADAALTGGGGDIDGPINFGNGVGVSTRNAADTFNISTIFMDNSDNINVGQSGANTPNDLNLIQSGKVSIKDGAGVEVFAFNTNGVVSGIDAQYIDFNDAGFTATNVDAALVELLNEKVGLGGGTITGELVFDNDVGISGFNFAGTPVQLMEINSSDNVVFGSGATKPNNFEFTMAQDFVIRNSIGSELFRFRQDGTFSGLDADGIVVSPTGGIQSTDVQAALAELDSEKLKRNGGIVTNNLTFENNTPLRMEKADTSDVDVMKVNTSNHLVFGSTSNRFTNYDITMDGDFIVRDTNGTEIFKVTQAGVITGTDASNISFTPTGSVSSTNVQAAIAELDSEKLASSTAASTYLGINAKAADSDLLDGNNSTVYLVTNANRTISDNIELRFGNGNDMRLSSDGTNGEISMYNGNLLIKDGSTTRFTFTRTTGALTATGNVTAFSDKRVKKNVEVIENALDKVSQLTGYTYDRTDIDVPRQTGIMAQDLQKVLPEAVEEDEFGQLSVAYGNTVGLLIESIKELKAEIEELKRGK